MSFRFGKREVGDEVAAQLNKNTKPSSLSSSNVIKTEMEEKNDSDTRSQVVEELENLCAAVQTTAVLLSYMGTQQDNLEIRTELVNQKKACRKSVQTLEKLLPLLKSEDSPQFSKLQSDFVRLRQLSDDYFSTKLKQLEKKYPEKNLRNETVQNVDNQPKSSGHAIHVDKNELFEMLKKPERDPTEPYFEPMTQEQLLLEEELVFVPYNEKEEELQDLRNLHNDLRELYGMSQDLHMEVAQQGEKVVQIQNNVEQAELSARQGTRYLQEAKKIGAVGAIMIGGAVGGLVLGGPIGAIVGLKAGAILGAASGVGGLVVGATTGGILSKWGTSISSNIAGAYSKVTAPFKPKEQPNPVK